MLHRRIEDFSVLTSKNEMLLQNWTSFFLEGKRIRQRCRILWVRNWNYYCKIKKLLNAHADIKICPIYIANTFNFVIVNSIVKSKKCFWKRAETKSLKIVNTKNGNFVPGCITVCVLTSQPVVHYYRLVKFMSLFGQLELQLAFDLRNRKSSKCASTLI